MSNIPHLTQTGPEQTYSVAAVEEMPEGAFAGSSADDGSADEKGVLCCILQLVAVLLAFL